MGRRSKDYENKQAHIGSFNIKELQKYIKENNISDINATMLMILAKLSNEYLQSIENEGVLYHYTTADNLPRTKRNQLIDSIIPTFTMISKILKDNNLVLEKKCVSTEEKKEEKDGLELLIDNLNKFKDAV